MSAVELMNASDKTLAERIRVDWIAARKAKHESTASVLGVLIGAIQTTEKNFQPERNLTDDEIFATIKKLRDGVRESLKLTPEDHPNAEKLKMEESALSVYMPPELSDEQLHQIINDAVSGGSQMKDIMQLLKTKYPSQYDGKKASDLIKSALASK